MISERYLWMGCSFEICLFVLAQICWLIYVLSLIIVLKERIIETSTQITYALWIFFCCHKLLQSWKLVSYNSLLSGAKTLKNEVSSLVQYLLILRCSATCISG